MEIGIEERRNYVIEPAGPRLAGKAGAATR